MTWEEKDKLYNKNRQLFNKDKVCTVPQKGYDDYYIVNAKDMKVENTDLDGINDTMKTGKIKSLFIFNLTIKENFNRKELFFLKSNLFFMLNVYITHF